MQNEIKRICALYDDPASAAQILQEALEDGIRSRFGEEQFKRFIRELDPTNVDSNTLLEEGYEPLEQYERDKMTQAEIKEFEDEKRQFIEQETEKQKRELTRARVAIAIDALNSKHYREAKQPIGLERPTIKEISTPMGGQPGYRRRMKRR